MVCFILPAEIFHYAAQWAVIGLSVIVAHSRSCGVFANADLEISHNVIIDESSQCLRGVATAEQSKEAAVDLCTPCTSTKPPLLSHSLISRGKLFT